MFVWRLPYIPILHTFAPYLLLIYWEYTLRGALPTLTEHPHIRSLLLPYIQLVAYLFAYRITIPTTQDLIDQVLIMLCGDEMNMSHCDPESLLALGLHKILFSMRACRSLAFQIIHICNRNHFFSSTCSCTEPLQFVASSCSFFAALVASNGRGFRT